MKRISMLLTTLLLLSSCESIDGQLSVDKTFSAHQKYGVFNRKTREVKIGKDTYTASLDFTSKKKLALNLEGGSVGKLSVIIKSDENFDLPEDGEFLVTHDQIDQPFDIKGSVDTSVTLSDVQHGTKSCTWEIKDRLCENFICRDVVVKINGQQEYDYTTTYTTKKVSLKILKQNSEEVLATFAGSSVEKEQVSTDTGPCR